MITVTDVAAEKLKAILEEEGQPEAALRVIVVPNGGGAQYMLALEDNIAVDDLVVSQAGVRVIADVDSAPLLEGAEIDYSEGLMRSGFVINNPNIQSTGGSCGCGAGGCGSGGGCGCGAGGCGGH
jgi:iron-sulfur cluster assembly accessory protein